MDWFTISNVSEIDTPALALYPDRVQQNIDGLIARVGQAGRLRPHVKTNKIPEVCQMMMASGINKFKCATLAEARMLADIGAPDVLLAYQPLAAKAKKWVDLVGSYPQTTFSCLVDHPEAAKALAALAEPAQTLNVFIDVNDGMNRTGIAPAGAVALIETIQQLPTLRILGLHVYDGHITSSDPRERQQQADQAFAPVTELIKQFQILTGREPLIVAGGSATFSTHLNRAVQSSPGTFVFWDWGYAKKYPEEPFVFAALVLTRIISVVSPTLVTTDLGYKSVASENPLPRVHFLNAPDATPVSQSEEHLTLQVPDSSAYSLGQVLYGVPVHICPSVALYDEALVIRDGHIAGRWTVVGRKREY